MCDHPPTGQRSSPWEKSSQLPPGGEVVPGTGNKCDVLELLLAAILGEGSRKDNVLPVILLISTLSYKLLFGLCKFSLFQAPGQSE